MNKHYPVIIVGGGQAGLSVSYCLKQKNIDHIVFEKGRIGDTWRLKRWDSFCLVTPNWQCRLPGFSYPYDDPEGFMVKDEIVRYIEEYASSFDPPVREGVKVNSVEKGKVARFYVATSIGDFSADQVVIAVGGFHFPAVPEMSKKLPEDILQLHSSEYKNPEKLPDKEVLVVGSGQSGCQIAEDLHLAGRKVHLAVGSAPRSPRKYRGKDVVEWLEEMGYYELPVDKHPDGEKARDKTNHYLTGRDGGREIDLRKFALEGMKLYGPLSGIEEEKFHFSPKLKENLDKADQSYNGIRKKIDEYILRSKIDAPEEPPYEPVWQPEKEITEVDFRKSNIGTVIWGIGYGFDFQSWINFEVFDERGYPVFKRGVTDQEGLYFIGLSWLYTWGSGRFSGIARDAGYLTEIINNVCQQAGAVKGVEVESGKGS